MSAMAKYSANDYKKIALNLKKRFRNATEGERKVKEALWKGGSGLVGTAAAAAAAGAISKAALANGKSDPMTIDQLGGLPVPFFVGLTVAAGSLLIKPKNDKKRLARESVASAGTHIAAGALYKYIYDQTSK